MKDIILTISGQQAIAERDEKEKIELATEGKFACKTSQRGQIIYLMYEESEVSGVVGVKTRLRIGDDGSIRMQRLGENGKSRTVMNFEPGKRFQGIYHTPYGAVDMELLTNLVEADILPEEARGEIHIDYEIVLKGLMESHNVLHIAFWERFDNSRFLS